MPDTPAVIEPPVLAPKWAGLLFAVRRSIRYHTYRRRFFDNLSGWTDFLVILSGGTVLYLSGGTTAAASPGISYGMAVTGAVVAILGSLDLVIGFSIKARDYHDLARDFSSLEIAMIDIGENPTDEQYAQMYKRRLEIEQDEPPAKRNLDIYCHNELCIATGVPKSKTYDLKWYRRMFMQFFDISPEKVKLFTAE